MPYGNGTDDLYLVLDSSTWFCPGLLLSSGPSCVQTGGANLWYTLFDVDAQDVDDDGADDLILRGAIDVWTCYGPGIASGVSCELENP